MDSIASSNFKSYIKAWSRGLFEIIFHPIDFMALVDRIRFGHQSTMWHSFKENPIWGWGLGWFYPNYLQYFDLFKNKAILFSDPPASFYLMFLSDLGLSAIFIFFSFAVIFIFCLKNVFRYDSYDSLLLPSIGAMTSLLACWIIGIHFIFDSIAFLTAFIITCLIAHFMRFASNRWKYFAIVGLALAVAVLSLRSIFLIFNAPPVPEFLWNRRAKPQIPASLIVPIQAPKNGYWLAAGVPYFVDNPKLQLFAEMPPGKYPLKIKMELQYTSTKVIATNIHQIDEYTLPTPGKSYWVDFSNHWIEHCPDKPTISDYCSIKVSVEPEWVWNKQPIGVYLY
ncbi:MAG: hypothetical protein R3B45_14115 [Bdellovibrionota bacterium]